VIIAAPFISFEQGLGSPAALVVVKALPRANVTSAGIIKRLSNPLKLELDDRRIS
jgi:hypothetical protein